MVGDRLFILGFSGLGPRLRGDDDPNYYLLIPNPETLSSIFKFPSTQYLAPRPASVGTTLGLELGFEEGAVNSDEVGEDAECEGQEATGK